MVGNSILHYTLLYYNTLEYIKIYYKLANGHKRRIYKGLREEIDDRERCRMTIEKMEKNLKMQDICQ